MTLGPKQINLVDVADPDILKAIWRKKVRKGLRTIRLGEFELEHDPLEVLGFDWELDDIVDDTCESIKNGTYRAHGMTLVRGAKSVGLTRPLACLDPRDLLVYVSLISRFENDLLTSAKPWARFGRAQASTDDGGSSAESGWFRLWLKRQGQIWILNSTYDWLVESDVSNFFGSLSIDRVCEHVLNSSRADTEVVGLLRHMLEAFVPMQHYRRSTVGGLPQENFDGSRVIAHTMLTPLDEEFEPEGTSDRYSRWVDDIVVAANTWPEALQQVARIQRTLEGLGLYPNGSKTRIVARADFAHAHYKVENDYLEGVSEEVGANGAPNDPREYATFVHRHLNERPPRRAWERVTRRIYTTSRRTGDNRLVRHAYGHLRNYPGSSAQILEYLATFRLTQERFVELAQVLDEFGGVYDDIELRAREYLLLVPNVNSPSLRTSVAEWALASVRVSRDHHPAVAASSSLIAAKFGMPTHINELKAIYQILTADSLLRRQLAVILLSLDRLQIADLSPETYVSLPSSAQDLRFLRAVTTGEKKALNMCMSIMQPVERQSPDRVIIRPRALMLGPLVARAAGPRNDAQRRSWISKLKSNPPRLRDAAAIRWIEAGGSDPS